MDDVASSRDLERQDCKPTNGVLPSTGEPPGWIDEATNVHRECSVDRVHHSKFSQCLHHQVHHDTNDGESNDHSGWSTGNEGTGGTDEQSGANSTATATNISPLSNRSRLVASAKTYIAIICIWRPFR